MKFGGLRKPAVCGDGILSPDEKCDPTSPESSALCCSATCTLIPNKLFCGATSQFCAERPVCTVKGACESQCHLSLFASRR
jgi:hypothetical protein